jgi:hypothetical protein
MDVTSLVFALAFVGQSTTGDRYGTPNYAPTGGATLSTPTSTYAPSPASPGYTPSAGAAAPMSSPPPSYTPSAVPPDPLFTAAAQKKTPTNGTTGNSTSGNPPANTVAPISTPVPSSGSGNATNSPPRSSATTTAAPTPPPAVPDSARAAELVREAISLPKSTTVEGKERSLYETLAPLSDRRRQLDAVSAYWRLAADTAEYHFDWQQTQFLEHLQKAMNGRGNDATTAAEVGSRLAASQARQRESELRLYDAQFELAQRSWQADGGARPLTVDLPHTGSYKTKFDSLFGGGIPSGRLVLLNRTLPMRQEIVNARAESVWAAQSGYEQTFSAFQQGRLPAEEVLAALDDFRRRRSEFLTAVRKYNDEIAEYAFMSAPEGISTAALVGMLLKNPAKPAASAVSEAMGPPPFIDVGVTPATYIAPPASTGTPTLAPPLATPQPDPISAPAGAPLPPPMTSPTAVPPNVLPPNVLPPPNAQSLQPAAAAPSIAFDPADLSVPLAPGSVPPAITPEMQRPAANSGGALPVANAAAGNPLRGQPTLAPPPTSAASSPVVNSPYAAAPSSPLPVAPSTSAVVPTSASNPYAPASGSPVGVAPPASSSPPGMLPPFVPQQAQPAPLPQSRYKVHTTNFQSAAPTDSARAQAVQELVEATYDPRSTPFAGTPITLAACLANVSPDRRTEVLAIYWFAAEQRAKYRTWAQSYDVLNGITPQSPLQSSAVLAALAERTEAGITLEQARLRLTLSVGASVEEPWLLPETLPHGGRYDTKAQALSERIKADSRLQRDVERIAAMYEMLQWRAEAVTAARTAAQGTVSRARQQQTASHIPLQAVEREAQETCELLETTTRYNLAIADYALSVLPMTAPRDTLVSALVVGRNNAVASRP